MIIEQCLSWKTSFLCPSSNENKSNTQLAICSGRYVKVYFTKNLKIKLFHPLVNSIFTHCILLNISCVNTFVEQQYTFTTNEKKKMRSIATNIEQMNKFVVVNDFALSVKELKLKKIGFLYKWKEKDFVFCCIKLFMI